MAPSQIVFSVRRADRGAGELSIGQPDAVPAGHREKLLQVVGADPVSRPSRAAVDRHQQLPLPEAESARCRRVEDLVHGFQLQ
jgi:hypothetical protein